MASLEAYTNEEVRSFMRELAIELQQATPKDTTNASYNWIWDLVRRIAPAGSRQAVNTGPYFAGLSLAARFTIRMGMAYMENLVHYIGALDQGWSPQAPPHFVLLIIRRVMARRGAAT